MLIRLRHSWYELGFPSNTGMYESLVKLVSKVEELVLDMKSNKKELCVPKKQVNLSSLRTGTQVTYVYQRNKWTCPVCGQEHK